MKCENSIKTKYIECIIGRKEIDKLLKNKEIDFKKYILISIINPGNRYLNIEKDIKKIKEFINNNEENSKKIYFYKGNGQFYTKVIHKNIKKEMNELSEYLKNLENYLEKKYKEDGNIVDINSKKIDKKLLEKFYRNFTIDFWDIEKNIDRYQIISDNKAKIIYNFIMENRRDIVFNNKRYIIHCSAGKSRSAAVGLAIHFLYENYNSIDKFLKNCEIIKHKRYQPNMTVFKKIINNHILTNES